MTLRLLESGYWHLRLNRQVWAQWPKGRDPQPDDCFQPQWSWPLIEKAWAEVGHD